MGLNHEKNGGRKSRDTLPLISKLKGLISDFGPYYRGRAKSISGTYPIS